MTKEIKLSKKDQETLKSINERIDNIERMCRSKLEGERSMFAQYERHLRKTLIIPRPYVLKKDFSAFVLKSKNHNK